MLSSTGLARSSNESCSGSSEWRSSDGTEHRFKQPLDCGLLRRNYSGSLRRRFRQQDGLRHLVQTVPLWLGVVLALLGVRVAKWVVLPILLFWLAAMTFIWLFLLGWSRVISGHFSPVEIAMTVVIGTSALIGLLFSMKRQAAGHTVGSKLCVLAFGCVPVRCV